MTHTIKIGVVGCAGRMGKALIAAITAHPNAKFVGGTESPKSSSIGTPISDTGLMIGGDPLTLFQEADVVIDFTCPTASVTHAKLAAKSHTALVVGTTGLSADDHKILDDAAQETVIFQSNNMSLGVALLAALTKKVAAALGDNFDIEILEMHHRHKIDAPSGTALMLGEAAADGRDVSLDAHSVKSRDGITGARTKGDIGFATLRGGGTIGDHSVIFASDHERITLAHRADDRGLFADGAVRAAIWVANKKTGRYAVEDILDFK